MTKNKNACFKKRRSHAMSNLNIIAGAVIGTSAMTGFSYGVANLTQQQFREPELLNKLISPTVPEPVQSTAYGWIIHYGVGLGFMFTYHQVWTRNRTNTLLKNTLVLGLASGILGASVWAAVLKLHPHAPSVNVKRFLPHLIAAHIVFAFFAKRGYKNCRA